MVERGTKYSITYSLGGLFVLPKMAQVDHLKYDVPPCNVMGREDFNRVNDVSWM